MKEGDCTYKIVAFIDGQRTTIECNEKNGCLSELVWSGIGVRAAAEKVLDLPEKSVTDAYVDGNCIKQKHP